MVVCPQALSLRSDLSRQPSCLPPFFFYGCIIIIYSFSMGMCNIASTRRSCDALHLITNREDREIAITWCRAPRNLSSIVCTYIYRMLNRVCTKEFESWRFLNMLDKIDSNLWLL